MILSKVFIVDFDNEVVKYSYDNGVKWYDEDEIRWALSLLSNITPRELEEAIEAKSKSCENCNHYKNIDSSMPSLLECSMKISQHPSDSYFLVDEDFCCNRHEPKIIKALEK